MIPHHVLSHISAVAARERQPKRLLCWYPGRRDVRPASNPGPLAESGDWGMDYADYRWEQARETMLVVAGLAAGALLVGGSIAAWLIWG